MTDKEARRILIDIADQMPSDVCADWIDAISVGIQAIDAQQTKMRDATEEERKSVRDYIESISKPTGVRFDAQLMDVKETIIKSALKGLVKMQIEEGSVGFAVDNDPDHDCCWDDILAWLEAQPTHGSTYGDVSWADIRKAYIEGYNYGVKDWFKSKTQPCEDVVSRQAVLDTIGNVPDHNDGMVFEALSHAQRDVALLPSVKPRYTDEEIDKAQAVEQAYVDKMVELAVEETKRPKGKWMKVDDEEPIAYDCSECNSMVSKKYNYCPECGADMRGVDEESI